MRDPTATRTTGPERGLRCVIMLLSVAMVSLAACSSSGGTTGPAAATSASAPRETATPWSSPANSSPPEPMTFVALGDSWPEGAHCGYCETFAGRYADGLETLTGRPVDFVDLTGSAQPFFQTAGGGTASLLRALREDSSFADQVALGDVIMIAAGPNELGRAFDPYAKGQCGDGFACVQRLEYFRAKLHRVGREPLRRARIRDEEVRRAN
jgi:hypothetical protein